MYNVFDTAKFLNRPAEVVITNLSGLAGIAHWINRHYNLDGKDKIDKKDPLVAKIKQWVDNEYENGRVIGISDEELESLIQEYAPGRFKTR